MKKKKRGLLEVLLVLAVVALTTAYFRDSGNEDAISEVPSKNQVRTVPSALCLAAGRGDNTEVERLIKEGADPNGPGKFGTAPLHYCVSVGHLEATRLLLKAGADPNWKADRDVSPMHAAANAGQVEALDIMIAGGAAINVVDSAGKTPMDYARDAGHPEVAEHLLAAMESQIEIVDY
jgi:ankyrin repeat protein